jgi:hypothetical protein
MRPTIRVHGPRQCSGEPNQLVKLPGAGDAGGLLCELYLNRMGQSNIIRFALILIIIHNSLALTRRSAGDCGAGRVYIKYITHVPGEVIPR